MTPSNPTNSQPLIYRIADKLGVFHLVAPVDHTHAQSEVEGLAAALAAKANAIPAGSPTGAIVIVGTSGEISRSNKTITDLLNAIAAKADKNKLGDSDTLVQIDNDTLYLSALRKIVLGIVDPDDEFVEISNDNIPNLRRALAEPDTAPTANSTNLVTSGGVAAAIAQLANLIPAHQIADILPAEANSYSAELHDQWIANTWDYLLQTDRSIKIIMSVNGYSESPSGSTLLGELSVEITLIPGQKTTVNFESLCDAQFISEIGETGDRYELNYYQLKTTDTAEDKTVCLISAFVSSAS